MRPRLAGARVGLNVYVTPALRDELKAEAWAERRSLSDYMSGILELRARLWEERARRVESGDEHG